MMLISTRYFWFGMWLLVGNKGWTVGSIAAVDFFVQING